MFLLKLNLREEGQLHANFLFYILIMQRKFFVFQWLNRGIRMYLTILIGMENRRFNSWKIGDILLKYVDFQSQVSRWRPLFCQLLVLYSHYFTKMPCFPVLQSWHTYVLCHPNRGWKWTFHYLKNRWYSSEKCLLWILISKVKVSSMFYILIM